MSMQHARSLIHTHRVRLGLSPEQFAIRVRVSGPTVRRVEEGLKPTLATQKKFADQLGLEVDDLFGMPTLPARRARA